jgi:hypothetical protein
LLNDYRKSIRRLVVVDKTISYRRRVCPVIRLIISSRESEQ